MFPEYHLKLFSDLENLIATNDSFYAQTFELDSSIYKIYNYRISSYSDFCLPSALEARGITFEVTKSGQPLRLASLPFKKFFNLNECPFTMNLDLTKTVRLQEKRDGSLMSTLLHRPDKIYLKSRGSLFSEQCLNAMEWLERSDNQVFARQLLLAAKSGLTVNMEWCSPTNLIVVRYPEHSLTVLSIRDMADGSDVDINRYPHLSELKKRMVQEVPPSIEFINQIPDMTEGEGFVGIMEDGLRWKLKNKRYLNLHKLRATTDSKRNLYEAVLLETVDDVRANFYDDKVVISKIDEMEQFVKHEYNNLVKLTEQFYDQNKMLGRKEFAVLGQKMLDKHQFRLAMSKYTGKPVDFKQYMLDHDKEFLTAFKPRSPFAETSE